MPRALSGKYESPRILLLGLSLKPFRGVIARGTSEE